MERRVHQKLNNAKQLQDSAETTGNESQSKKRSRGAVQRAKKKQKKTSDNSDGAEVDRKGLKAALTTKPTEKLPPVPKPKSKGNNKQGKKRQVDKSEDLLSAAESLAMASAPVKDATLVKSKKRWFEQ